MNQSIKSKIQELEALVRTQHPEDATAFELFISYTETEYGFRHTTPASLKRRGATMRDLSGKWIEISAEEPEKISAPKFDRSKLPDCANVAMAMNADGLWFSYSEIPTCGAVTWLATNFANYVVVFPDIAPKWRGHWKDSLIIF